MSRYKVLDAIGEYVEREYDTDADFSDLKRVPLAYTTDEDTDEEIQVYANVIDGRLFTEVDGVVVMDIEFPPRRAC